ncbi:MAG: polysaccharide deacetylase family protein [Flavobacteriales bacterium]
MLNFFLFVAHYIGINSLFYFLTRSRQRVITYHNIIEDKFYDDAPHLGVSHSKSNFEVQIREINKRFAFTTVIDKPKSAIITFDDGYQNNFYEALPLLNKYNVKAIFFITSDLIDSKKPLWIDQILLWFSYVPSGKYEIENLTFTICDSNRLEAYIKLYKYLTANFNRLNSVLHQLNSSFLFSKLTVDTIYYNSRFLGLTSQQIDSMKKQNQIIACHSKSHAILSKLVSSDLKDEINFCQTKLDTIYNSSFFSYPFGSEIEVNDGVKKCLENSNFTHSFMNIWCWTKVECMYSISRLSLPNTNSKHIIHAHLSGLYYFLKYLFKK